MAKARNNHLIGVCLVLLANVFLHTEAVLKTHFMEDLCENKKTSFIDLRYQVSGILMSVPQFTRYGDFDCEVQLLPSTGDSIVLSILRYDVDSQDTLTIEDSDRHMIALIGHGNFKDEKKAIISEGKMNVRYQRSNASILHQRSGFQFTFTKVKDSPCHDNEFQCQNGKCLLKDLLCDKHNHCGDRSDQKKCGPDVTDKSKVTERQGEFQNTSMIWVITISVGGIIFLIFLIVSIVVFVHRAKMNKPKTSDPNSTPNTDTNVPLQTVASSVPHQPPTGGMQQPATVPPAAVPPSVAPAAAATSATASPAAAPPGSFYNRIRRSIRGPKNSVEELHHSHQQRMEPYQVPSMYPSLDQLPSAPEMYGVDNADFKIEE